jgi:hypothetical protein
MLKTLRPLHRVFMEFLIEKDQLTAHFNRFSTGFILDNQLKIAREHLSTMGKLLEEVEQQKSIPQKFDCYSGQCYKK